MVTGEPRGPRAGAWGTTSGAAVLRRLALILLADLVEEVPPGVWCNADSGVIHPCGDGPVSDRRSDRHTTCAVNITALARRLVGT